MYLLYMGLNIISGLVVYYFVKETKDLPMEELAALFGDDVVVHITKDGMAIAEDPRLDKVKSLQIEDVETRGGTVRKAEVDNEVEVTHTEFVKG